MDLKTQDKITYMIAGASASILLVFAFAPVERPTATAKQTFQVVDSYHGCDIVRYSDITNRWHYFMKCHD